MTSHDTSHDPRVDAYIARSADFAQPILEYVRMLVHEACPDVEETIKWGMPTFMHAGSMLCGMAAFKQHASFGFWKHALVVDDAAASTEGMGSFGKLASVADLPTKRQLLAYLKKAMRLNEQGTKTSGARKTATPKPLPKMPADFAAALRANPAAKTAFEHFAPSHRREYLEWILDAKREDTRARRIAQAVEWLAEGKSRNWKYENC
jgi:uncharacterized protein YdeI (YjbR/CyaY-like superfamily)